MSDDGKKEEKGIKWITSAAREILLEDLGPRGWLWNDPDDNVEDLSAEVVHSIYRYTHPEEFKNVPFSQFKARYDYQVKIAATRRKRSNQESEWLKHDRLLHPRKSIDLRGNLVFDMHPAKAMLRYDIKNGMHELMSAEELYESRTDYMEFDLKMFRRRIWQELRRVKMLNWMEHKRTEKRRKEAEAREKEKKKAEEAKKDGVQEMGQTIAT